MGKNGWLIVPSLLALAALSLFFGLAFTTTTPYSDTEDTEFYVLNSNGNAANYPTELNAGESGTVIISIHHHSPTPIVYTVFVDLLDGSENQNIETESITLNGDEKWETSISFSSRVVGQHPLQMELYRGENPDRSKTADRTLRLWITITPNDTDDDAILMNSTAGSDRGNNDTNR